MGCIARQAKMALRMTERARLLDVDQVLAGDEQAYTAAPLVDRVPVERPSRRAAPGTLPAELI